MKPYLITTSAHMDNNDRIIEYVESFKSLNEFKTNFESITIIETISNIKLDYLENTGFELFYSDLGNPSSNKGVNWLNHVTNFLNLSKIKDEDILIFITGRYKMINTNILSLVNEYMVKNDYEFIAKEDNDLYVGDIHGVHTFYMAFTKSKFIQFSNWYQKNGQNKNCIEWDVKKFLETNDKCYILSRKIIMGVETKVFGSTLNKIC